ncbi:RICIN domain-containing protein [Marinagarivorans algicola]|uniref:RICIN domain-containing protein n=1 Tax=Marinagarivorans algicola TaxID=1513270 RepID=UPI0006B9C497|nr:RICIN domain-containing protein [Marinagarivorans algicola]
MKTRRYSDVIKKTLRTHIWLTCSALGAVVASLSGQAHAANNGTAPEGYVAICSYGQACAVAKSSLVAFGSQGQYAYKILNGAFTCSERAFNRVASDTENATCSVAVKKTQKAHTFIQSAAELSDGTYAIISRHSAKALFLNAQGMLQQAPYTGSAEQHFTITKRKDGYFSITSHHNSALEIKDWQTSDGAQVTAGTVADSWNQQWLISDSDPNYVSIASRFNGKSLDLFGLNTHNSAQVRLWTYWGGNNQQWQLVPANTATQSSSSQAVNF